MSSLRFTGDWRTTVFAALMVPVLASLGFWQLSRAQEKQIIIREFEVKQAQRPALLSELATLDTSELAYHPVRLTGQFRNEYFLLDNRMAQGRYGNEVIGVFEDAASDALVLVNRGWIVADAARRSLPQPPAIEGEVTFGGQVYVSPGKPYLLRDDSLPEGWPKRIQAVQMEKLATALGVSEDQLFPYPVRIASGAPGALYVDWPVVNQSAAKHYGYAVQWFAMSLVLALLYLLRSTNLLALWRGESK